MTGDSGHRPKAILNGLFYAIAIGFFLYLFYYFWTSDGGPTLLAMTMVPIAFVLFVLNALRDDDLYPALPPAANYLIAAVLIMRSLAEATGGAACSLARSIRSCRGSNAPQDSTITCLPASSIGRQIFSSSEAGAHSTARSA